MSVGRVGWPRAGRETGHVEWQRVVVAGAGISGRSAAEAAVLAGADVLVTDANPQRLAALGLDGVRTAVGLVEPPSETDLVVTSPGWRPDAPLLAAARAAGIEVIGEVELAWRLDQQLPGGPARWLGVTGTNGKTTTVGMLESVLKAAGLDAVACGNVGLPVVDAVRARHRVLAVELSSFQLYWSPSVRPHAGAVLNVAEDHLDWHGSMQSYAQAKARLLTGAHAVAGIDDPWAARLLAEAPAPNKIGFTLGDPRPGGYGVRGEQLVDGDGTPLVAVHELRPTGPTGVLNALAAAALAGTLPVRADAVGAGLREFEPGGHRGALVGERGGVRYVDDSKATNPHAAAAALSGHERVVWIAGGLLKGAAVDDLVAGAAEKLAGVVLIGADRVVIAAALARHAPDVPVHEVSSGDHEAMIEVVRAASEMARPGEVVLLAPAAASMDMFTDYAHRGDAFAAAVRALPSGAG